MRLSSSRPSARRVIVLLDVRGMQESAKIALIRFLTPDRFMLCFSFSSVFFVMRPGRESTAGRFGPIEAGRDCTNIYHLHHFILGKGGNFLREIKFAPICHFSEIPG